LGLHFEERLVSDQALFLSTDHLEIGFIEQVRVNMLVSSMCSPCGAVLATSQIRR
jgi:hypothetical protein